MKQGKKEGFASLLDEIGAGAPPVCDSEQLTLFEDVHEAAQAGKDVSGVSGADSLNRGRGRPKGAQNKTTRATRDYLRKKYPVMPLEFLVGLLNQSTMEVALQRCCKFSDALKIQCSAASAALPYMHQKMPVEVEVSDTKRHLVLMEGMTSEAKELLRQEDAIIIEVDENGDEITD